MAGLPAYMSPSSRVIRMPTNELDKSTIVSLLPKMIEEYKPTIFPGRFIIPAAKKDDFEILVVTSSSWFREMEEGVPHLEIQTGSQNVARSIVEDYSNGLLACDMGDRRPGLFWIPGEYDKTTIHTYRERKIGKEFKVLLEEAKQRQRNWFEALVTMADVLWVRSSGNPLSVDDNMKMAAMYLSLEKPWTKQAQAVAMTNCKACGALVNPSYPVCANCKNVIDVKKAAELGLKFAS